MKTILALLLLSCVIALPVSAELTDTDLDKIRLIIQEEIEPVKIDVANIKGRLNGVEKQVTHTTNVTYGLIALIVAAIGIPTWRGKRDRDQEQKIKELASEIESLKRSHT